MRRWTLPMAFLAALIATPGLAQTTPEPTERARALAQQYVDLMDLQGMMQDQMVGTAEMADDWADVFAPTGPGAPKPEGSADMPVFIPEDTLAAVSPMVELMEEVMVEAHVQVFTEAELEALVEFYSGDVGRGIVGKQSELSLTMTNLMMERMPEMLASMGLGDLTGEGEETELAMPTMDDWADPTPPLVRQMSPGY